MTDEKTSLFDGEYEREDRLVFSADDSDVGVRIDKFLADRCGESRSYIVRIIDAGLVTVSGREISKNYKLTSGDSVEVYMPEPEDADILPEDIPLDIVYEDADIIVINKPEGMIVHPAPGIYAGTLVNALMYHCKDSLSGIGGVIRPGIVHRIDKDTSGLLVVAKNDDAHLSLSAQLKTHDISRIYHAITVGNIRDDEGTVNRPIGRHPSDRKKMAVLPEDSKHRAREAITHYEVIERFAISTGRFTYVKCRLETGRTHQIRVHMSSTGHPLLGDSVYGGSGTKFESSNKALIHGQCLHAKCLELTHPRTGELMRFECELPENFEILLDKLRGKTQGKEG